MKAAEDRLKSLGITAPDDIQVEAIAMDMGAFIKYEVQSSCEASITGYKDRAVIKVNPNVEPGRKRFSAAHECGHWELHRGREFRCRAEDIGYRNFDSVADPEKQANDYAASLLMPRFMFEPVLNSASHLSFDSIRAVADVFKTSLLSTAIRSIEFTAESAILLYIIPNKWKWFKESKDVPGWCWPQRQVDSDSFAAEILQGKTSTSLMKGVMPAETWFDFKKADDVDIYEESIPYAEGVLTLLTRLPT